MSTSPDTLPYEQLSVTAAPSVLSVPDYVPGSLSEGTVESGCVAVTVGGELSPALQAVLERMADFAIQVPAIGDNPDVNVDIFAFNS